MNIGGDARYRLRLHNIGVLLARTRARTWHARVYAGDIEMRRMWRERDDVCRIKFVYAYFAYMRGRVVVRECDVLASVRMRMRIGSIQICPPLAL